MRRKRVRKLASLSKDGKWDYAAKLSRRYDAAQSMKKGSVERKRLAKTIRRRRNMLKAGWKEGWG